MKTGHLDNVKHVEEDCFVSPVVITVKNDIGKNYIGLEKIERQLHKNPTTHAKHGKTVISQSR